jgi:hypothetical protein
MLFKQLIVLLMAFIQGCAYHPAVFISGGVRQIDGDVGHAWCLGAVQKFQYQTELELEHCSDPFKGEYLFNNNKPDISTETLQFRKYWGGKKRQ